MRIYIKNMVCNRCIMVVQQELENLKFPAAQVRLGEIELDKSPTVKQRLLLRDRLKLLGFEVLDNQKQQQIEKIKNLLIDKVQGGKIEDHFSLSKFLSKSLLKDYSYISRLFSEVEGMTLEQFFILQKIEKVKEWLVYNELTLSEIAVKLGYSSTAHLSAQFKKTTGLTPSQLKKIGAEQRKSLDKVQRN
jgi:AraC family transcriptional regulator